MGSKPRLENVFFCIKHLHQLYSHVANLKILHVGHFPKSLRTICNLEMIKGAIFGSNCATTWLEI